MVEVPLVPCADYHAEALRRAGIPYTRTAPPERAEGTSTVLVPEWVVRVLTALRVGRGERLTVDERAVVLAAVHADPEFQAALLATYAVLPRRSGRHAPLFDMLVVRGLIGRRPGEPAQPPG